MNTTMSPEFIPTANSEDNIVVLEIRISWRHQYGAYEERDNLVGFNFTLPGSASFNSLTTQQATTFGSITLFNKDYRYTPDRISSEYIGVDDELWDYIRAIPEDGFKILIKGGFKYPSLWEELVTIYNGRVIDYSHNETSNTVTWTLVDLTWQALQQKNSTVVFSGMDYSEISTQYKSETYNPIGGVGGSQRTHHVWMDDDSFMNDMFKLSNSTLGYRYDNPRGISPHFLSLDEIYVDNRDDNDLMTPLFYFDPNHSYSDIESRTNINNRPTEIIANFSPRYAGSQQLLFELDEPLTVTAAESDIVSTSKTFYLKSSQPMYNVFQPVLGENYAITSGVGLNMKDFVTVDFSFAAQQVTVTMTNTHPYHNGIMRYLTVYGNPVYGSPSGREKKFYDTGTGFKRSRSVGDPFYVQTRSHAKWLTDILYNRIPYIISTRRVSSVPPLFYLDVGDLVEYKLVNGAEKIKAIIGSVSTNYDGEKVLQDFVLIDYKFLYPAPDENYFVLGDSLDDSKVVFY